MRQFLFTIMLAATLELFVEATFLRDLKFLHRKDLCSSGDYNCLSTSTFATMPCTETKSYSTVHTTTTIFHTTYVTPVATTESTSTSTTMIEWGSWSTWASVLISSNTTAHTSSSTTSTDSLSSSQSSIQVPAPSAGSVSTIPKSMSFSPSATSSQTITCTTTTNPVFTSQVSPLISSNSISRTSGTTSTTETPCPCSILDTSRSMSTDPAGSTTLSLRPDATSVSSHVSSSRASTAPSSSQYTGSVSRVSVANLNQAYLAIAIAILQGVI